MKHTRRLLLTVCFAALLCLLPCAGALAESEILIASEPIPSYMDADVEIYVLNDSEFGVNVKYGGTKAAYPVSISIYSEYKKAWITARTTDGGQKFMYEDFVGPIGTDTPRYFFSKIIVNKEKGAGMSPFEAESFCFHAGKPSTVILGSTSAPYVQGLMYNDEDALHTVFEVNPSAENDADQTIKVVVGGGSGNGTATLWQGNTQLGSEVSAARQNDTLTFTFTGKWGRELKAGQEVSVKYKVNGTEYGVKSQIAVKQGKTTKAATAANGSFNIKDGKMSVTIPDGVPIFGKAELSFKVPTHGLFFYLDMRGKIMFGYDASGSPVENDKKGVDADKWKKASNSKMDEWAKDATDKMEKEAKRVEKGVGQKKGVVGSTKISNKFSVSYGFGAVAMGEIDTATWIAKLKGSAGFTLKFDFKHTQKLQMGPVPAFIKFGAKLEANVGMACSITINNAQNIFAGSWDFNDMAWTFRLKFGISLTAGVGVDKIANLFVEGGAFIEPAITVAKTTDSAKPYPHTTVGAGAYVKVGVEILGYSATKTLINEKWPKLYDSWDNKSAAALTGVDYSTVPAIEVTLTEAQETQLLEDACIGEFNADGSFKAPTAHTADILRSTVMSVFNSSDETDTMQANKVVRVLADTYSVANTLVDPLPENPSNRVILFIASAKHSDGRTRMSLVCGMLRTDGSVPQESLCIAANVPGEVYEFDLCRSNDKDRGGEVYDVALVYRDSGSGHDRKTHLYYTYFRPNMDNSAMRNLTLNDKQWDASTAVYHYQARMPKICTKDGKDINIIYAEHWTEGWDTSGKTYIYSYKQKSDGSWYDWINVDSFYGALTSLLIVPDSESPDTAARTAYIYNRDADMDTDTDLKLVFGKTSRGSYYESQSVTGNFRYISANADGEYVYIADNKLYVSHASTMTTVSADISIPSNNYQVIMFRDGGDYREHYYRGYLVWTENAKDSEAAAEGQHFAFKAIRLDFGVDYTSGLRVLATQPFTLLESGTRIDQYGLFANAYDFFDILYTTSKGNGQFKADMYYAPMTSQAGVELLAASTEDGYVGIGDKIVLYLELKNISNSYLKYAKINLTGLGGAFDQDYIIELGANGENHVMTMNDLDMNAINDRLAGTTESFLLEELLASGQYSLNPTDLRGLFAPGTQRTFKLEIPTNKNLTPGKKTLHLKVVDASYPNLAQEVLSGANDQWSTAQPKAAASPTLLLNTGVTEVAIDETDLSVRSNVIDMDGERFMEVFIANNSIVPATVNLKLTGVLSGRNVTLYSKSLSNVNCGTVDASGKTSGGCVTLLIPMTSIFTGDYAAAAQQVDTLTVSVTDGASYNDPDWDMQDYAVLNPSAELTVRDPASITALEDTDATFSVTAAGGNPRYSFQWMQRAPGAVDYTPVSKANVTTDGATSALTLRKVDLAHSGYRYSCVVTDLSGVTVWSGEGTLTVTKVPPVTGDRTPLGYLTLALLVSLLGLGCTLFIRRRKA